MSEADLGLLLTSKLGLRADPSQEEEGGFCSTVMEFHALLPFWLVI